MIEPPPQYTPNDMLNVEKVTPKRGEDLLRFSTNQHRLYCGIDLQARTMDVCLVRHAGALLLQPEANRLRRLPEKRKKSTKWCRDRVSPAVPQALYTAACR
jgi:hypothetical protein